MKQETKIILILSDMMSFANYSMEVARASVTLLDAVLTVLTITEYAEKTVHWCVFMKQISGIQLFSLFSC